MRAVIVALIVVIVVVILLKFKNGKSNTRSMSIEDTKTLEAADSDITEPSQMPTYKMSSLDDNPPVPVANYTNVPSGVAEYLKAYEAPGITIVDDKIATQNYIMSGSHEEISVMQQEAAKETYYQLMDPYYKPPDVLAQTSFIASLGVNKDCQNLHPDCDKWKYTNDCMINPEFMFKNCPNTCNVCHLDEKQKFALAKIYNSRDTFGCVAHGGYSLS